METKVYKVKRFFSQEEGSAMAVLWDALDVFYPRSWRSCLLETRDRWALAWASVFVEAGLTPQDILDIVPKIPLHCSPDFLPSLGSIVQLALKERRGSVDSPKVAFHKAVECLLKEREKPINWDPVLYWTVQEVGAQEVLSSSWENIRKDWEEAYWRNVDAPSLPEVPKREQVVQQQEKKDYLSKEEAKAIIQSILRRAKNDQSNLTDLSSQ